MNTDSTSENNSILLYSQFTMAQKCFVAELQGVEI